MVTLLCCTSLARAQVMVEVPNAPPPLQSPPAPSLTTPLSATELCAVVHALERNDRHARNRSLIAAGSTLLATGYAAALTLGALTVNGEDESGNSMVTAQGATLFVPVVGPFISGPLSNSAAWAIPVMLVDGVAQVAGLVLVIEGARGERKLALTPIVGSSTVGIGLSGRL